MNRFVKMLLRRLKLKEKFRMKKLQKNKLLLNQLKKLNKKKLRNKLTMHLNSNLLLKLNWKRLKKQLNMQNSKKINLLKRIYLKKQNLKNKLLKNC